MNATAARERCRTWRAPRLVDRVELPRLASIARALERLARRALSNVSAALPACTAATHCEPARRGYRAGAGTDRAWSLACDEREAFCVVESVSERTMLGWLIGGTTARSLSPIECRIVAECLRRLFAGDDGSGTLREEARLRPTADALHCSLELQGRDGRTATIHLYLEDDRRETEVTAVRPPDLRDVSLHVRANLPSVGVHLADVRSWREGSIVPLLRAESNVAVTLAVGAKRVAVAQLGCLGGRRAVRIVMVGVGRP